MYYSWYYSQTDFQRRKRRQCNSEYSLKGNFHANQMITMQSLTARLNSRPVLGSTANLKKRTQIIAQPQIGYRGERRTWHGLHDTRSNREILTRKWTWWLASKCVSCKSFNQFYCYLNPSSPTLGAKKDCSGFTLLSSWTPPQLLSHSPSSEEEGKKKRKHTIHGLR